MKHQFLCIVALAIIHYPHAVYPAVANKGDSPINALQDETNGKIDDLKDDLHRINENLALPLPGKGNPGEEAAAIVGSFAAGGAKIGFNALKIQSKLVAPLFKIGAKISAPIIKLKSKFAAPFALGGAFLSKPFVHTGAKIIAPTVKFAQVSTQKFAKVAAPLSKGFADAFSPITDANKPIADALKPLDAAVKIGLGPVNFQQKLDNIHFPEFDNIQNAAEGLQQDAINAAVLVTDVTNNAIDNIADSFANGLDVERKRRSVGHENYGEHVEEIMAEGDDSNFVQSGEDLPEPSTEDVDLSSESVNAAAAEPANAQAFDPSASTSRPVSPKSQCMASRVGLETSECHRVERYQTRSCLFASCPRGIQNLLDQIHHRCQWSQTGSYCEKHCFSFEDSELGTCIDCSLSFTRLLKSNSPFCRRMEDCILGSKICKQFNPFRPLEAQSQQE